MHSHFRMHSRLHALDGRGSEPSRKAVEVLDRWMGAVQSLELERVDKNLQVPDTRSTCLLECSGRRKLLSFVCEAVGAVPVKPREQGEAVGGPRGCYDVWVLFFLLRDAEAVACSCLRYASSPHACGQKTRTRVYELSNLFRRARP